MTLPSRTLGAELGSSLMISSLSPWCRRRGSPCQHTMVWMSLSYSGGGSIPKSESTGPLSKDGICICACVLASQSLPPRPCFSCAVCIIDGLRQFANGELFTNPGTLHCFFTLPAMLCFGCSGCFSRFRPKYNANSSERPALITLCEMGGSYALPHHSLPSLTAIIIWEGPENILIYLLRIYLLH